MTGGVLSRRRFLKAGTAGLALGCLTGKAGATDEGPQENMRSGVLVDLTRCIGCRACENACRVRQGRASLPTAPFGYGAGEGKLSFTSWTVVDFHEAGHRVPVKKQCMHCLDPACVSACPVAALYQTPRGSVAYRADRCLGCRYCMVACPFNVPRYEWYEGLTPRVGKCDFCDDRVASGLAPACVTACPTGALKFGKRADIIREATARMFGDPKRYATIYGDKVVGGTSWIYLSDVPMNKLGFRTDLPDLPLASLTWKALARVPVVVVVLGLFLSAAYRLRGHRSAHA
jgi:formate dehydrogenase iron-sulfur subunit